MDIKPDYSTKTKRRGHAINNQETKGELGKPRPTSANEACRDGNVKNILIRDHRENPQIVGEGRTNIPR